MNDSDRFIRIHDGMLFGDIINGFVGMTAEDVLLQVKGNPYATNPDEKFFFSYYPDNNEIDRYFNASDIANILNIELENLD